LVGDEIIGQVFWENFGKGVLEVVKKTNRWSTIFGYTDCAPLTFISIREKLLRITFLLNLTTALLSRIQAQQCKRPEILRVRKMYYKKS
jgi:hypothetical protein